MLQNLLNGNVSFQGMQNVQNSMQIGSILKAFQPYLPKSTIQILQKHQQQMAKAGTSMIKTEMNMNLINNLFK